MTIESLVTRLCRAQALYRKAVKHPRTVDEFLADRHEGEARRDAVLSGKSED